MDRVEDDVVDSFFDADSERRSADHVPVAVRAIVDSVVEAVLDTPVSYPPVTRREFVNPVAIVMRIVSPEMTRTVVRHEVTVTRRDPVDVPVLTDPYEITAVLLHHILA